MILLDQGMGGRLIVVATILCQLTLLALRNGRERYFSLTTDDRSVHLNARPNRDSGKILHQNEKIK